MTCTRSHTVHGTAGIQTLIVWLRDKACRRAVGFTQVSVFSVHLQPLTASVTVGRPPRHSSRLPGAPCEAWKKSIPLVCSWVSSFIFNAI